MLNTRSGQGTRQHQYYMLEKAEKQVARRLSTRQYQMLAASAPCTAMLYRLQFMAILLACVRDGTAAALLAELTAT
jgi:hypothetical protein